MNTMRVGFLTLLVFRELGIALPLSLLVDCSIVSEKWNKNLAASVTGLARGPSFLQGAVPRTGSVSSSAPDFLLTCNSLTLLLLLISSYCF